MPELVVFIVRAGVLALLWLFVLAAVLVVRSDLRGARPRAARAGPRPARGAGERGVPSRGRAAARKLVVVQGPLAGTSVPLGDTPVTIGRAEDSTLVLSDDYISSRHARLVPGDHGWVLEDLGSTNGTFLDGQKVSQPTPVPVGKAIRIGRTTLELRR